MARPESPSSPCLALLWLEVAFTWLFVAPRMQEVAQALIQKHEGAGNSGLGAWV